MHMYAIFVHICQALFILFIVILDEPKGMSIFIILYIIASFRRLFMTGFLIIPANLCGFPIAEEKGTVPKFTIIRKWVLCPRF
ncbi:MAG: hypothetical protein A2Y70_03060 [Candidatus Aminicenantes bacterium RBG_13_64_14]|nr:MAG: hypothetical protein A2Y70_03060 [Candidatus Aminicenantes bacterium RBG_13_64_14]